MGFRSTNERRPVLKKRNANRCVQVEQLFYGFVGPFYSIGLFFLQRLSELKISVYPLLLSFKFFIAP